MIRATPRLCGVNIVSPERLQVQTTYLPRILDTKSCKKRSASTSTQTFALGVTLSTPSITYRSPRGKLRSTSPWRFATVSPRVNAPRVSTSTCISCPFTKVESIDTATADGSYIGGPGEPNCVEMLVMNFRIDTMKSLIGP